MKRYLFGFQLISLVLLSQLAYGQTFYDEAYLQELRSKKPIENIISLSISKGQYDKLAEISGEKQWLKKINCVVNGDTISVDNIHTRGNTTLHYRRKSLSFNLQN